MLIAVITVLLETDLVESPLLIIAGILTGTIIGTWLAVRVEMTGMPELVALFNGFGGAASALVALAEEIEGPVTPDMIRQAEWIAGVETTEEERELMLAGCRGAERRQVQRRVAGKAQTATGDLETPLQEIRVVSPPAHAGPES